MRSRSADWGRTRAAVRVVPIGVEVRDELRFGGDAVLEVDDQPVEADPGQDLGHDRRAERANEP